MGRSAPHQRPKWSTEYNLISSTIVPLSIAIQLRHSQPFLVLRSVSTEPRFFPQLRKGETDVKKKLRRRMRPRPMDLRYERNRQLIARWLRAPVSASIAAAV